MCDRLNAPALAPIPSFMIAGRQVRLHRRVRSPRAARGLNVYTTISPDTYARIEAAAKLNGISCASVVASIVEEVVGADHVAA